MEQAMEQRMANRIPWQSSDPAAILRVGERSALTLHRYNRDAAQLVRVGLDRNPFAAVLLNRLLLRRHLIAEDLTDTLIDVCLKALADAESQGGVEDALDLAPLCAALIFLGQREQAARALTLCRQACPDIEKGIEFSHKLRRLVCVEADSAFLFQIEMLNLFYRTFPLMWNEQILYHYGLELPTGGHCPAALASLIHQAAQDLSYRYLNNLFVLLIDLSPADAGLDPVAVTEQAFSVRSAEIFRALLFCRKIFPQDVDGLTRWWAILQQHWEDQNAWWQQLRGWFTLYYVSRSIRLEPNRAARLLDQYPKLLPPPEKTFQKTSRVVQRTLAVLFFEPGDVLIRYVRWCEAYNPFAYHVGEERTPFFYPDWKLDMDRAFRFQCSQGRTGQELVYLYMNTFARCNFNLHYLGRILLLDPELRPNQYGTVTVEQLFSAYPISAELVHQGNNYFMQPLNVRAQDPSLLLVPPDWVREHQALLDSSFPNGSRLPCVVFRLDSASGRAYAKPKPDQEQSAVALQHSWQEFDAFCSRLQQIADTGQFDLLVNREIQRLGIPKKLPFPQLIRIQRLAVACCTALLSTPGQARYFVLMFNNLHRGRLNQYRFPFQNARRRISTFVDRQLFSDCRALWQKIREIHPEWDELLFVYLNTPFKMCVSLGELVRLYFPPDSQRLDLLPLFQSPYPYWFAGVVEGRLTAEESPLNCECLVLRPLEFSSGPSKWRESFLYPISGPDDEIPTGDTLYAFRIGSYCPGERYFILEELAPAEDRRRIAPKAVFMEALEKASCTATLDPVVRRDLSLPAGALTWEDRTEVLTMTLQVLYLRGGDAAAMEEFLKAMGPNNPWPDAPDTGKNEWALDYSRNSLLNGLVYLLSQRQELGISLHIYFSSVLRAVLPLNRLLSAYIRAGHSLLLLPEHMKCHPLTLYFDPAGTHTSGFRVGVWQLQSAEPSSGKLITRVVGYDCESDCLILRADASDGS